MNEENPTPENGGAAILLHKEASPPSPTRERSTLGTLFPPSSKGEEDGSAMPGVWLTVSMHSTFEKVKVRGCMILNYTRLWHIRLPANISSFIIILVSAMKLPSCRIQFDFLSPSDSSLWLIYQHIWKWVILFHISSSLHSFLLACSLSVSIPSQILVWKSIAWKTVILNSCWTRYFQGLLSTMSVRPVFTGKNKNKNET